MYFNESDLFFSNSKTIIKKIIHNKNYTEDLKYLKKLKNDIKEYSQASIYLEFKFIEFFEEINKTKAKQSCTV